MRKAQRTARWIDLFVSDTQSTYLTEFPIQVLDGCIPEENV